MKTIANNSFLVYYILNETKAQNVDNISRTKAYERFFRTYPEIKWAFLASIVSRNAGWNMTDLTIHPFRTLLGERERNHLFLTYERANWLIFSDAYPQLLVYQFSKKFQKPLFHLLAQFKVSEFMVKEWNHFWKTKDEYRLMAALIINEQQVIDESVIQKESFQRNVFRQFPYRVQDALYFNAVIVPTRKGELYGIYVHQFEKVDKRIEIGKRIATLIFSEEHFEDVWNFAKNVEHTGSRKDYERFLSIRLPQSSVLRACFPRVHHQEIERKDWYMNKRVRKKWFRYPEIETKQISQSYYQKRKWLYRYAWIKRFIINMKKNPR